MTTIVHERVAAAREESNPTVICRVRSGWIVLGDNQFLRGYSLLLPDPVVTDLNTLDVAGRTQFCLDMIGLGDALLRVTGAYRINYSVAGNLDPALHAHVTPRYLDEPEDRRRGPTSLYTGAPRIPFDVHRDAELMAAVRGDLDCHGYLAGPEGRMR